MILPKDNAGFNWFSRIFILVFVIARNEAISLVIDMSFDFVNVIASFLAMTYFTEMSKPETENCDWKLQLLAQIEEESPELNKLIFLARKQRPQEARFMV